MNFRKNNLWNFKKCISAKFSFQNVLFDLIFFKKIQAIKMCYLPIFRNVFSASEPFFKQNLWKKRNFLENFEKKDLREMKCHVLDEILKIS